MLPRMKEKIEQALERNWANSNFKIYWLVGPIAVSRIHRLMKGGFLTAPRRDLAQNGIYFQSISAT